MEDFIYNESIEDLGKASTTANEDDAPEEQASHVSSENDCPNIIENFDAWNETDESENPIQLQEYEYIQEDRNGDGIIDAIYIVEDTNGDGIMNQLTSYLDEDFDGNFETTKIESDTNGDGIFDFWYKGMDINGDGSDDVMEIQQDTNHTGFVDTYEMRMDSDGDGNVDFALKERDYNDDGVFDSVRIYEDSDANGIIDTMTEIYDSNHDGQLDRADIHHDYDEDGRDDWTQICRYDPSNGTVIPINEPPQYAGAIAGTTYEELNQFEPGPDYPEGITGDPSSSMEHWEFQGNTGRCALYSQKFIVEEFTGQNISIDEFANIATSNGWFSEDFGTTFLNTNKMLDYYGIENEMTFHNDINDIENCLDEGGRVIVAIDADEIWYGEGDDLFSPMSGANHAVEVIGIDYSNPEQPMIILNDSGSPYGKGEMIPFEDFMDAWKDGECQMIKCYPNK